VAILSHNGPTVKGLHESPPKSSYVACQPSVSHH